MKELADKIAVEKRNKKELETHKYIITCSPNPFDLAHIFDKENAEIFTVWFQKRIPIEEFRVRMAQAFGDI